jgi:glycogen operon protein
MLLGGDELGRSQHGNNNAYCHDDELSWYDWDSVDEDLLSFTKTVIALRRKSTSFTPRDYLVGAEAARAQMLLYRADGELMQGEDWHEPDTLTLAVGLDGRRIEDSDGRVGDELFLLLINAHHETVEFIVPGTGVTWRVVLTTNDNTDEQSVKAGDPVQLRDRCLMLLERE